MALSPWNCELILQGKRLPAPWQVQSPRDLEDKCMLCALKSGLQRKKTPPFPTAGLFVFDWGHMRTERGIQNAAGQSSSRTDSFLLCPARREEWTPADRFPSAPAVKTCAGLGGILPSSTAERSRPLPGNLPPTLPSAICHSASSFDPPACWVECC